MPAYKETPAPAAGPLYAGNWDSRGPIHGWRPRGTKDWLMFYTQAGRCLVRAEGRDYHGGAGEVFLYRPGTPQDYGQHEPNGRWRHVWVHWIPRTEVLEWLAWPELSPGLHRLQVPPELRPAVWREFTLADSVLRSKVHRAEFLAANAVERALLLCSRINPREGHPRRDPRIQQAVDRLARNLVERHPLEKLARRFGFSRSRFAALFRAQVGQPPGHYLEAQRLAQARHLLAYTNQTLDEISAQVGFSSPFYLSLRFKHHFGQSPRAFRKQDARKSTSSKGTSAKVGRAGSWQGPEDISRW